MSLIDLIRSAAADIPPSHKPANMTDAVELVGGLIAYAEHGAEKFEQAVKDGKVSDLYKSEEQLADAQATPQSLEEANAEIAALKQQLANAQAVSQKTEVGPVTPGAAA